MKRDGLKPRSYNRQIDTFVAVYPLRPIDQKLVSLMGGLNQAQGVVYSLYNFANCPDPQNPYLYMPHIKLRRLGAVTISDLRKIKEKIQKTANETPRFRVVLHGYDVYERFPGSQVLCLNVLSQGLIDLHRKLDFSSEIKCLPQEKYNPALDLLNVDSSRVSARAVSDVIRNSKQPHFEFDADAISVTQVTEHVNFLRRVDGKKEMIEKKTFISRQTPYRLKGKKQTA